MKYNNRIGKCAICGVGTVLTYEHIPPQKAFNFQNAKLIKGDEIIKLVTEKNRKPWDTTGLKYEQRQRGVGEYSLCAKCNNLMGAYYAEFYCEFANRIMYTILSNYSEYRTANDLVTNYMFFKPLNFIKQVLSMFCTTTKGLIEEYEVVSEVLLNKEKILLNPDFKIWMAFLKNQKTSYSGAMAYLYTDDDSIKNKVISEIVAFPFVFVFSYDKNIQEKRMVDITSFFNYKYDEKIELKMEFPIVERNGIFPLDFRTEKEFK